MANGLYEGKRQVGDLRKALGGRVRLADPALDPLFAELELLAGGAAATEWYSVVPREALDWIDGYVPQLAGVLETDVLKRVRDIVAGAMLEGKTTEGTMAALKAAHVQVDAFARHRVEAIARTESVRAYNIGHLIALKGTEGVAGVEFTAILDDRTSDACQAREGLRLRIDDPRLASNTPPLHPNCRSALIPILDLEVPEGWKGDPGKADALAVSDPTVQRPEDIDAVRKVLGGIGNSPNAAGSQQTTGRTKIDLPFVADPVNRKWAEDVLDNAPDEIRNIVAGLNPPPIYNEISGAKSYADPFGKSISLGAQTRKDKDRYEHVFFHELGHLIDTRVAPASSSPGSSLSCSSGTEIFDAITRDRKSFSGRKTPARLAKEKDLRDTVDTLSKWYNDPEVSDIVCSMTKARFSGGWCHSARYYKTTGYANTEVFANLFALKTRRKDEAFEVIRGLFPNTAEAFERFLSAQGGVSGVP